MKKIITIVLILFLWIDTSNAQDPKSIFNSNLADAKPSLADSDSLTYKTGTTVTDIDGNIYHTVKIG